MTGDQIIFLILGAFVLGTGYIVVTGRNLFHAALAMMACFLGVAGLYISLDAGFLAAAQLLVYIGAISILIIFAIMLTRNMMHTEESAFNSQSIFGLVTAAISFAVMVAVIAQFWPTAADATQFLAGRTAVSETILRDSVVNLGQAFVSADAYVLPFEIASVLLLAALIGAILVAWPNTEESV